MSVAMKSDACELWQQWWTLYLIWLMRVGKKLEIGKSMWLLNYLLLWALGTQEKHKF